MANIFLTRKCNLKCSYCFADEFVNKTNEEISNENFEYAINFIKKSESTLGLIGGEPMLHPSFEKFITKINKDAKIKNATIYTNGLLLEKYINELSNNKISILINCNAPTDIGDLNFNKLKNNLILLKKIKSNNFNLGINLYSQDMNYSFIFDLLELTNSNNIRFSMALQNENKKNTENVLESFKKIKPFLFKFFNDCYERNIVPYNDCNSIPDCILSIEDKRLLLKIEALAIKQKKLSIIKTLGCCSPVIDILPDLNAVRCFGFSKELKIDIRKFKSLEALNTYFINKIDIYAKAIFECNDCDECKNRLLSKCGICYTYKIDRIRKVKQIISKEINTF